MFYVLECFMTKFCTGSLLQELLIPLLIFIWGLPNIMWVVERVMSGYLHRRMGDVYSHHWAYMVNSLHK